MSEFKESEHNRDDTGKFSTTSSSTDSSKESKGSYEEQSNKYDVSKEEIRAVQDWQDNAIYREIDAYNNGTYEKEYGKEVPENIKKNVNTIDSLMERTSLPQLEVHSGISFKSPSDIEKFREGNIVSENSYLATSKDSEVSLKYADKTAHGGIVISTTIPAGHKGIDLEQDLKGRVLTGEREVTLPRKTAYRVDSLEGPDENGIYKARVTLMNKFYNSKVRNWRIDEDGMLRVTARVLAQGVFPYTKEESPENSVTNESGYVDQYIPIEEFTEEALHSLEGKPVIVKDHVWRDADNTMKDGLTVGAIAGTPKVEDGYIVADFIISDNDTIEDIKAGKLIEVSSAYDGDCIAEQGEYEGSAFGAVQKNLRFNHVLLLPDGAGRCGHEVRIVNQNKAKEKTMPKVIQRQFGNRRVDFKFQNEEDAQVANEMAEEERKFNADALANAMNEAAQLKNEIEEKQKALEEALHTIADQKEEIDRLMSAETQEELAQEAAAQAEAEDAILDEAVENEVIEEEEKEEIKNSFKNCKTFADRRRVVVQNAMQVEASAMKDWSQDAIDGAFESLHRQANLHSKRVRNNKTVMGGAKGRTQNSGISTLQRILRPMKLQNSKNAE